MATPPASPSPSTRWVVLRRQACTEPDLPHGTGYCLAIGEQPPGLAELLVSPLVPSGNGAVVRNPFVAAADSSGILLVSGSPDEDRHNRTCHFLCDAVSNTVRQLPDLPHSGNAALIVGDNNNPGSDFVVAELLVRPFPCNTANMYFFSPGTGREWIHKTLPVPPGMRRPWRTDRAFSYTGKLLWADLTQGLLVCDPSSTDAHLRFLPFPNLKRMPGQQRQLAKRDPSCHQRCVDLSDGKLRYLELTTMPYHVPRIRYWTLNDLDAGKLTQDHEFSCRDIWDDSSFHKTGFPNHVPVFAVIHPTDPQVLYFFLRGTLFSFDLRAKTVMECFSNHIGLDEPEPSSSSNFVLAWKIPPSLKVSIGSLYRKQSHSPFDRVAASFSDACDNALLDMEIEQFTKIALDELNKDITEKMKKFTESESLYLCYFDDEVDTAVEYAHLNFSARL
ncbi:hypothetical protein QOZ80_6BG0467550 [Eleusine coracana subsp. coracana]|nr:hypothetical protein QOZ80_6BG0467550 [Eleusine coracana subsp. coracana]